MKIGIFGGDKRMLFAARAFADEGHEVYAAGFGRLTSMCEICICTVEEAAERCDIAVLPVRPIADGALYAPFSKESIDPAGLLNRIGKKPVFTGCAGMLRQYPCNDVSDYSVDETFTTRNAVLTAEGAVGILIRDYEGSVSGTEMLITGYGRIGKILCAYLSAMGAVVTAAARDPFDRLIIESRGMKAVDYPEIDPSRYPVIINTVPALVLDKTAVDNMSGDVFIIDLASAPGGVDHQRAQERDLTCIHALLLPGRTAPLAAGIIIKDTVLKMLSRGTAAEL